MNGWEPAEVTTFEYDGDRLVRSVTVREPEYDDVERALLLASRRHERDVGEHGIPMSQAMDPANQFAFEGYEVPRMDWARKSLEDARDRYYAANPGASRAGHLWGVKRRDG